jgi:GcrA cell cycle regulator
VSWSDDRISTLKKMWQQGKSASEIAEKLGGVTRNAVIGKAHRLGLSGRPSPIKPVVAKKPVAAPAKKELPPAKKPAAVAAKPMAPAKKPVAPVAAAKPVVAPKATPAAKPVPNAPGRPPEPIVLAALANATSRKDGKVLSILELNERMCRWPVGDPKEAGFGYCGSVSVTGHPYCAEHVAIAFQAPNRKDKKPHKDIKIAETPELEDLEVEVEDDEEAEDETLADDLDDEEDDKHVKI